MHASNENTRPCLRNSYFYTCFFNSANLDELDIIVISSVIYKNERARR